MKPWDLELITRRTRDKFESGSKEYILLDKLSDEIISWIVEQEDKRRGGCHD